MSLSITLNQATLDALSAEASARNSTSEEVASAVLEDYFSQPQSPNPEYDAWFRAKYEKGMIAYERGDYRANEEVEREAQSRRARIRAKIAANR